MVLNSRRVCFVGGRLGPSYTVSSAVSQVMGARTMLVLNLSIIDLTLTSVYIETSDKLGGVQPLVSLEVSMRTLKLSQTNQDKGFVRPYKLSVPASLHQ